MSGGGGGMAESYPFGYQPALDGVRAVSVALVLAFHGGVALFGGGYIGVSVFFTLSGYLITSLLWREWQVEGRIDVFSFWARRARRLLPASVVCLALVIACARAGWFDGVANLRRDALGSLFQVQNWVALAGDGSYAEVLQRDAGVASPLDHYWSLAIEEQFYWVWPLAFWGIAVVATSATGRRTSRPVVLTLVAVAATFALAAPLIAATFGPDAAYWATPARLAEILVGAALALVLARRAPGRAAPMLAVAGLGAILAAAVLLPSDGGPAYGGALPLVGLASAAVIAGLQRPSAVRATLSWAPIVAVGRVSYGVYLYHWPLFVLLDHQRTGLDGVALFAVRIGAVAIASALSYHLVEWPIRQRRWPNPGTLGVAAAGGSVAAVALFAATLPTLPTDYWRVDAATVAANDPVTAADEDDATAAAPPGSGATGAPGANDPVRIMVLGDSTAMATATGLRLWAAARGDVEIVEVATPGCGFVRGGIWDVEESQELQDNCDTALDRWLPDRLNRQPPDVVMLMSTASDVADHRFAPGDDLMGPPDGEFAAKMEADYLAITDQVAAGGVPVVWVVPPPVFPYWRYGITSELDRVAVRDDVIRQLDRSRDDVIALDLLAWCDDRDLTEDRAARPDGIHWTPETAQHIATAFLGPALLDAAASAD